MSGLTENQKLVMLGMRSPNQSQSAGNETTRVLKNNIAQEWETYQENFEDANLSSWSDYETWLTNNGISSSKASTIRSQLEGKYPDWSTFKDKTLNEYSSWFDWEADFQSNTGLRSDRTTDDGNAAAGVRVHEEGGVTRSGDSVPAGAIEVYGAEVHFAQTSTVQNTEEEDTSSSTDPLTYANLSIDDTTPVPYQDVDVSADVSNNTSNIPASVVVDLIVDGEVKHSKTVQIDPSTTKTVTITTEFREYETHEVTIGPLSPQTVTVVPPELV